MTDLVLVNPNNRIPAPFAAIEPPLWLGLIAGQNIAIGKDLTIIDAEMEAWTVEETVKQISALHPKVVIVVVMGNNPSVSSTPKMPVSRELYKQFTALRIEAILTGLHPSSVSGEWDFSSIHKPFDGWQSVPWEMFDLNKYRAHNWHCLDDIEKRSPYAVLYTSLGCPYDCFYCNIHTLYGQRGVSFRPLEDIFTELTYFAQRGIRNIKVWDELFTLNEARVHEICDYIIAKGYDFNIWAYARVGTVNEKMLKKMKQAGFNWLAYGFESGSDNLRRSQNKKISNLQIIRAIDETRNVGINIIANFMFGLPGETEKRRQQSLSLAIEENFEYVNFNVALPYPGSEWHATLKEKPMDWSSFNQFSPNICAAPEVVEFRDKAFDAYFSRSEYLDMIKTKFGKNAENHIREMLAWKIR